MANKADGKRNGVRFGPPKGSEGRKGKDHPGVKLTEENVKDIRRIYSEGKLSQYDLAKTFNVRRTTIAAIINNRSWKHVSA